MSLIATLGAIIGMIWALVVGAWLLAMAGAAFVLWCYWGTGQVKKDK